MTLGFTGERIVPGASDCEPTFAQKMYQEHVARYAFAAELARDADVLDVGCGVGYGSQLLAKAGAKSVLGIDLASDAIEHARAHYFHPSVTYKVQAAEQIEPGQGYDLITCFELIEHVAEQQRVLDLIKAALRPAGVVVISTPRPLDDARTHFHFHEMSFEEIYGSLRARFKYVKSQFEVNCFTSYVGSSVPDRLEHIVPVTESINLEHADYFVFLASDEPLEGARQPRPVLSLNDDAYILTLENDVRVLRQAEEWHLSRLANLEQEVSRLSKDANTTRALDSVLATVQQMEERWRSSLPSESELSQLQRALTEAEALREGLREKFAEAQAQLSEVNLQLSHVRQVLADRSEELAAAQTEAYQARSAIQELGATRERVSGLENELNAVRYRLDATEATLMRFRRSFSWKLTRPLRWVWRTYRKLVGRSLPQ